MKKSITIVFALLVLLLGVNFWLQQQSIEMLQENQQELAKLQGLRIDVKTLLATYLDAETGQRGFLLTGDPSYLVPYVRASKALAENDFEDTDSLAPKTYLQELRLSLQEYEQSKLVEMKRVLDLNATDGVQRAIAEVQTNEGRDTMDQLRARLAEVDAKLAQQSKDVLTRGSGDAAQSGTDRGCGRHHSRGGFDLFSTVDSSLSGAAGPFVGSGRFGEGRTCEVAGVGTGCAQRGGARESAQG